MRYIARLGADAAPALVEYLARERVTVPAGWVIPSTDSANHAVTTPASPVVAPANGAREAADYGERCEAARRLLHDWGPGIQTDWRSWTVSSGRARRAVASNVASLRRLAGPELLNGQWAGCARQQGSGRG